MSRRSSAGIAAFALLIATWLVATLVPTNYVVYSPGPTVNLLAKEKGGDLIRVSGAKAYRDKGALRLLTVCRAGPDDRVYLAEAMFAWLNPKQAVYRESDIYQPQENSDKVEAESAVDMVNSQDSAIAVGAPRARLQVRYVGADPRRDPRRTRRRRARGARQDPGRRRRHVRRPSRRSSPAIRKVAPGDKVTLRIQRRTRRRRSRSRPSPPRTTRRARRSRSPSAAATSSRSRSASRSAR